LPPGRVPSSADYPRGDYNPIKEMKFDIFFRKICQPRKIFTSSGPDKRGAKFNIILAVAAAVGYEKNQFTCSQKICIVTRVNEFMGFFFKYGFIL
jgi:hypothetical protein